MDILMGVGAFLGYGFVFTLPSFAVAMLIVVVFKLDTWWLHPLWILFTLLILYFTGTASMLTDLF
jgi:hypothetical protein